MEIKLNIADALIPGFTIGKPLMIAGPCSAETESQVMEVARQISALGIKLFRAGIWKPRTRPNAFEGVGSAGLEWLRRVREETGMKTMIEVANDRHVSEALKNGIDILWIGARTTANPFAVQEIADSLRGVDATVFVKNPVSPDVELWIGALERINAAGITRIGAIHRGFSSYGKSIYRNAPHWQIPIELRRRVPGLTIINDPSHIGGKRDMIMELCQTAIDLDFDGLIVETHCDPDRAWSDAAQQITPQHLEYIVRNLVLRRQHIDNPNDVTLEELRSQIDKLDNEVLRLMEQRMTISEKIGMFKKENNITILQTKRWNELLKNRLYAGLSKGLSEGFIQKIYSAIHEESIHHQKAVMNKNLYGLIGYPLSHSFSQKYFTEKFAKGGLAGYSYRNFPMSRITDLKTMLKQFPDLRGFNVTIPYKEQIIALMDELDDVAGETGAVNTVRIIRRGKDMYLKGYNTDVYGFTRSLEEWLAACDTALPRQALVLGTGGASKAVIYALSRLGVVAHPVSRRKGERVYQTYDLLNAADIAAHPLIVNTTPVGMYPNTEECPAIPYQYLTKKHYLYDLVYNPAETVFMRKGLERGASVCNGERMLHLQADGAWEIWKN